MTAGVVPTPAAVSAMAYWSTPGGGELRAEPVRSPGPGEAEVTTVHTGISPGTERLVHSGQVPVEVAAAMRAPFQQGDFGADVKYGYLSVGVIEALGPPVAAQHETPGTPPSALRVGDRVFCHYPHQDRYVVPVAAVTALPDGVPSARAVLAGTMETAINTLWDAQPLYGDRVAVIGVGLVGASIASLLRRFPLRTLVLIDPAPAVEQLAHDWGVAWLHPDQAEGEFDRVVHCSGTSAGLATGLSILGFEGTLIEASWFGRSAPSVPLGADFHARRLSIRATQVSAVAAANRSRRSRADRLDEALRALTDPIYDRLITGHSPFQDLPATMTELLGGAQSPWCHVVDYPRRAAPTPGPLMEDH